MRPPKTLIDIDLFAGGGGASEGIRLALGKNPDVAINHDLVAIAMHEANHPDTVHLRQDIWEVAPKWATKGKPVRLLWASPDCKHFSKAKGGGLTRSREIRSLAWVVEKWARDVRPRVIILENVEEFKTWGPVNSSGQIIKPHAGDTFRSFIRRLRRLGYTVDWKELRACDYGAPTIRKRLFMIARCDGVPITWPEPTHGPGLQPYKTAADVIDWSIPCPSIFERKRPLAENTLRRIAAGIRRYVIETADPFILPIANYNGRATVHNINEPLRTITAWPKGGHFSVVVPHFQRQFGSGVGHAADQPANTIMANGMGKTALCSAFLQKYYGASVGHQMNEPVHTQTQKSKNSLVTSHLLKMRGTAKDGQKIQQPLPTITAGGLHVGEVRAFLMKYYGNRSEHAVQYPIHTVRTKDCFGLVTVTINNEPYIISDIGLRMLSPRELFKAQGFDDSYIIDLEVNGRKITKTDQVRMVGNSVCPPIARALVASNVGILEKSGMNFKELAN